MVLHLRGVDGIVVHHPSISLHDGDPQLGRHQGQQAVDGAWDVLQHLCGVGVEPFAHSVGFCTPGALLLEQHDPHGEQREDHEETQCEFLLEFKLHLH